MSRKIYPGEIGTVEARKRRLRESGICTSCGKLPLRLGKRDRCQPCWERETARTRAWRVQLMREVIAAYGNKCKCCGETRFEFLSLDHVNNDGAKERRERGYKGGYAFYRTLRDRPLREDIQILCFNCNLAKQRCGGTCPHTWEVKEV